MGIQIKNEKRTVKIWHIVAVSILVAIFAVVTPVLGIIFHVNTACVTGELTDFSLGRAERVKEFYAIPDNIDVSLIRYVQQPAALRTTSKSWVYFNMDETDVDTYCNSLDEKWGIAHAYTTRIITIDNKDYVIKRSYNGNAITDITNDKEKLIIFESVNAQEKDELLVYIYRSGAVQGLTGLKRCNHNDAAYADYQI